MTDGSHEVDSDHRGWAGSAASLRGLIDGGETSSCRLRRSCQVRVGVADSRVIFTAVSGGIHRSMRLDRRLHSGLNGLGIIPKLHSHRPLEAKFTIDAATFINGAAFTIPVRSGPTSKSM